MFNHKTTSQKFKVFQQWKEKHFFLYMQDQTEVLKKINQAIIFKNNIEFTTFIKYYFGINFERQYFLDVFLNKTVVNQNKLINESINYLMSK